MLPHTGLFLLGKVALQMRIRRRLKISIFSDGIFFSKLNNSILNFYAKIMTNKSFLKKNNSILRHF